jgi:putative SOS response-associated peptidase YedK
LIPASGFYEWRPSDRQPFYFEMVDGLPLAFAGIWKRVGDHLEATVITTTPNGVELTRSYMNPHYPYPISHTRAFGA